MIIVTEPINHSPWLRRLRFATSVKINGSPDERPLEKSETDFIKDSLADVSVRYSRLFSRIERVFFEHTWFERSALWKRLLYRFAEGLDLFATRMPLIVLVPA
jgi:hypothetical protein